MYYAKCEPTHRTRRQPTRSAQRRSTVPSANILKREDGYEIELAVPGFTKEDINIELDDKILKVKSIREQNSDQEKYRLNEFNYMNFSRSFRLSQDVDVDKIVAKMENGILSLFIPFLPEIPAKKISIV